MPNQYRRHNHPPNTHTYRLSEFLKNDLAEARRAVHYTGEHPRVNYLIGTT
jgi:hypothetical protein